MNDASTTPHLKSWKRKVNIWAIVAMVAIFAAFFAIAALWIKITPADLVGYSVLTLGILVLGALSNRYEFVGITISKLFAAYFRFTVGMLISLGPLVLFTWLSRYVLSNHSLSYQLLVFVLWGLLLAWAVLVIFTERKREVFFARLQKLGSFTPIAYAFNLLMIAVTFFSSVTYMLLKQGAIALDATGKTEVTHGIISDFYLWHFLNAVPFLEVNETLRWKEPLTYESGWVGFALLIFKLLVILPVIAAFASYWKQVNNKSEKNLGSPK